MDNRKEIIMSEDNPTIADWPLRFLIPYVLVLAFIIFSFTCMACDGLKINEQLKIEQNYKELKI